MGRCTASIHGHRTASGIVNALHADAVAILFIVPFIHHLIPRIQIVAEVIMNELKQKNDGLQRVQLRR